MPVPTWRLAVLAAAGSVVLLVLPGDRWLRVVVLDAALAGVALLDWRLAPRSVRVRRRLPSALTVGGEGVVAWTVAGPVPRSTRVALADDLAPSLQAGTRRAAVVVPAGGEVTVTTSVRPTRRGRFELGGIDLRVEGPMGLVARQHRRDLPATLRVLPAFPSRGEAERRAVRARQAGIRTARGRGGGTEFDQLRDYTTDDEFRRIDWAATARVRRPIVRSYRAEQHQPVVVLVDNGRTMAGQVAGVPRVEHAIDAALALATLASRLGDRVGLVAFDRRVRVIVPATAGRAQVGVVAEALYDLAPELAESDYRSAFVAAAARFRRRSLFVVLTEPAAGALDETLLPALGVLTRRHLVAVAAVRDPVVGQWATEPVGDGPGTAASVFRRASALDTLAERDRVASRLRARGALVVDAPPGRLVPELLDTYLGLKATGRL